MEPDQILATLNQAADAVRGVLDTLDDWGPAGTKPGQYQSDLVADMAALEVLNGAGLGVLSEETGVHNGDADILVALDPVDGSTNASRHIPWYATSLCALDAGGAVAALVVNQATGHRYEAIRGGGATVNGQPMAPSRCQSLDTALVGLVGCPPRYLGWRQMRAFGAAALDLCAVATGQIDAFLDCSIASHGPWDYLGGMLICQEAGAVVADARGRDLVVRSHGGRRIPVAAATPELLAEAVTARASF